MLKLKFNMIRQSFMKTSSQSDVQIVDVESIGRTLRRKEFCVHIASQNRASGELAFFLHRRFLLEIIEDNLLCLLIESRQRSHLIDYCFPFFRRILLGIISKMTTATLELIELFSLIYISLSECCDRKDDHENEKNRYFFW